MGVEILLTIVATFISVTIGGFISLIEPLLRKCIQKSPNKELAKTLAKIFSIKDYEEISYKERIKKSLDSLKNASVEMEKVTDEFNLIMIEKQKGIEILENKLLELSNQETELSAKVKNLENVPIEALGYFEKILQKGDKKSAYRDYLLFCLGVIVSAIVTLLLSSH